MPAELYVPTGCCDVCKVGRASTLRGYRYEGHVVAVLQLCGLCKRLPPVVAIAGALHLEATGTVAPWLEGVVSRVTGQKTLQRPRLPGR